MLIGHGRKGLVVLLVLSSRGHWQKSSRMVLAIHDSGSSKACKRVFVVSTEDDDVGGAAFHQGSICSRRRSCDGGAGDSAHAGCQEQSGRHAKILLAVAG